MRGILILMLQQLQLCLFQLLLLKQKLDLFVKLQSHLWIMLLIVSVSQMQVVNLNLNKIWYNFWTRVGSSEVYLMRTHNNHTKILEISDSYISFSVSIDYVRLNFFSFLLLGKAKLWLYADPLNSITSWDDLSWKFLIWFFPSGKTTY